MIPNKAFQLTALPLCSKASIEHGSYMDKKVIVMDDFDSKEVL